MPDLDAHMGLRATAPSPVVILTIDRHDGGQEKTAELEVMVSILR
jgi:hypothetical protein